jgi:hypothetical protein
MPTAYIEKLHKEGKGSISKLESEWEKAKKNAEDQGQGDNYAYMTKIFQSRVGASVLDPSMVEADTAYIDSLVEKGHDRQELEAQWEKAKKLANEAAKDNPNIQPSYAYTTGIFQHLIGITANSLSVQAAFKIVSRTNYIKKLAREGKHGTLKALEKKWDEAIAIANKNGIRAYGYATAVFQGLIGIKKNTAASRLFASTAYPDAYEAGQQAYMYGKSYNDHTYENEEEVKAFQLGWSSADDHGD